MKRYSEIPIKHHKHPQSKAFSQSFRLLLDIFPTSPKIRISHPNFQVSSIKAMLTATLQPQHIKKQRIEIQEMQTTLQSQADQKPLSPPSLQVLTPPPKTPNDREEGKEKGQDVSLAFIQKFKALSNVFWNIKSGSQAQYIANLERENRLMASAYHTLAGRLQMTNVVLQRRNETPHSWLNKQRRLVDQQIPLPGR